MNMNEQFEKGVEGGSACLTQRASEDEGVLKNSLFIKEYIRGK